MDSSIPGGTWVVEGVSGKGGTHHHSDFGLLDTAQFTTLNSEGISPIRRHHHGPSHSPESWLLPHFP